MNMLVLQHIIHKNVSSPLKREHLKMFPANRTYENVGKKEGEDTPKCM